MLLLIVTLFLGAIILGIFALLLDGQAKEKNFPLPPPAARDESLDESLKEELRVFKNEVESLKLENDRLKSELDLARMKEAALKEEISKTKTDNHRGDLEKLSAENTQLKESLKNKEEQLRQETAKRQDLGQQLKQQSEKLAAAPPPPPPPPPPIDSIPKEEHEALRKKFETAQEVLRRIHAS